MLYWLEHFGVAVAAVTGVLAAKGKRVDLFGVVVLALVTAFGGGTVRDVAMGDLPVFWVRDPHYVLNAAAVAVAWFFAARFYQFPELVLQVADAFALAFFTMVGTRKALLLGAPGSIAVLMGVVTGVVGGMVRDVLRGEIPLVFRREIHLYATAAFFGGTLFVLLHSHLSSSLNLTMGTAATLVLRLAGIRWKLGLPEFHAPEMGPAGLGVPDREGRPRPATLEKKVTL
jgi:uncharacterized membrane protein YeiH